MGRTIGIDLSEKYAMVSYYMEGMSEPSTFSMVTGSQVYQIPLCICKRKGMEQWLYGEDARKYALSKGTVCVENLFKKALAGEQVELEGRIYDTAKLFFLYLKRLISLPLQAGGIKESDRLAIVTAHMNQEIRKLILLFGEYMDISPKRFTLLDYRESFYYYALSQPKELYQHGAALYYYAGGKLKFWHLTRDKRTLPQVVSIEEKNYHSIAGNRDGAFCQFAESTLGGKIISSVYLIGDGFDGDWMKRSLTVVCRGKRAFMGKNLFCKGACYGASVKADPSSWKYVYLGDNEIRMNISLKVLHRGKSQFFTLITAGESWYEETGECEVILGEDTCLDFYLQPPDSRETAVRRLELNDLPEREGRTTRLRILAEPVARNKVKLTIKDMGFGEIVKSSEKTWEYVMTF